MAMLSSGSHTLTQSSLCCGSLEFCKKKRLDGEYITWIKLRLLCDADGYTLWKDNFTDLADVRACLESNGIDIYDVNEEIPGLYVARAKAKSIDELTEWNVDGPNEGLCVRTFLTCTDNNDHDLFGSDSCWLSTMISDKSVHNLYERIKAIPTSN